MTIGIKRLRQFQLGAETVAGTPVACDVLWRGLGMHEDGIEPMEVDEDIGILPGTDLIYIPKLYGKATLEGIANYQQLPHIFEAGIKAVGTGVQDGTGSDYIYSYPLSVSAINTVKPYTTKSGDNVQAEAMEYSLVEDFSLEGSGEDAVKISANWFGRQIATGTFDSIAVPTVEAILASTGALYLNDVGGGFGGTQVSDTLLDWKLNVKTGLVAVFTGDNEAKYFSVHKMVEPEVTLDVTFEHNTTSVAEKAAWRAGTTRAVQLVLTGSAFGTPGTTYSNHTLHIQLAGYWQKFAAISDSNGNDVVKGTLKARYNSTLADYVTLIVVNELTALP